MPTVTSTKHTATLRHGQAVRNPMPLYAGDGMSAYTQKVPAGSRGRVRKLSPYCFDGVELGLTAHVRFEFWRGLTLVTADVRVAQSALVGWDR